VENIRVEFNLSTIRTATDDLKVADVFKTKAKLLKITTEWSIMREVSFTQVKSNKTNYTKVCASIADGDNVSRDVCPRRLHASVPKNSCGYFMIKKYIGEHICNQPSLNSSHSKATTSFVCNVILLIVRKKLDMTLGYITDYNKARYHITISYNKVWDARTKALTQIFEK